VDNIEASIAAISEAILHHNYRLVILDGEDYEVRDIKTGELHWDLENSKVPLAKFDVELFLDICGRIYS
jgi:hypothetical protein